MTEDAGCRRYLTDFSRNKTEENDGFNLHYKNVFIKYLLIKCIKWSLYDGALDNFLIDLIFRLRNLLHCRIDINRLHFVFVWHLIHLNASNGVFTISSRQSISDI